MAMFDSLFSALGIEVLGAILGLPVLAIIGWIKRKWISGLWNSLKVARRLHKNGIINFFADRGEYVSNRKNGSISEYILTSNSQLVYVGLWLSHGIEMANIQKSLRKLVDKDCKLDFTFLDSDSGYIPELAEYLALDPATMSTRVRESYERLVEFRTTLPPHRQPQVIIRRHNKLLTSSAFLIDVNTPNEKVLIDWKSFSLGRDHSFGIEFGGPSAEKSLQKRLKESFEAVRNSAVV